MGVGAVIGRRAVTVRVISQVIGGAPKSSASSSISTTTCAATAAAAGAQPTDLPYTSSAPRRTAEITTISGRRAAST